MGCYIITHKRFKKFTDLSNYKIILVGAYRGHQFGDLFDDIGDNISKKNGSYCELTGIYWLWKHCQDEYIGIVHYRRYFTYKFLGKPITDAEIKRKLNKYDIILPFKVTFKKTIREQYCDGSGFEKDLVKLKNIISKLYPDYVEDFDNVFNGHDLYNFNMMITRRETFDSYCKWLFNILTVLETQVDTTDYNDYQKRIFGFLAERLETIWIKHHQNLKIFEMGVIAVEEKLTPLKKFLIASKRTVKFRLG